jgi:hypothetical protein
VGFSDSSSTGIDGWYKEINVLNIAINTISGSIARRKRRDIEIVKEVF